MNSEMNQLKLEQQNSKSQFEVFKRQRQSEQLNTKELAHKPSVVNAVNED